MSAVRFEKKLQNVYMIPFIGKCTRQYYILKRAACTCSKNIMNIMKNIMNIMEIIMRIMSNAGWWLPLEGEVWIGDTGISNFLVKFLKLGNGNPDEVILCTFLCILNIL